MEIVCSTDSKYIMPTGIMLTSLFESNRGEVVNVHLLHDQNSAVLLDSIRTIAARYQQNIQRKVRSPCYDYKSLTACRVRRNKTSYRVIATFRLCHGR